MALANPNPEITPEEAREAKPDAMICTGRSDYPNQVNNVLCFPYIFRGALDAGARTINEEMKQAAVKAIAGLAHEHSSEVAEKAYGGKPGVFGPDQLIPNPFDPRLILRIAPAVAKAAMETGVADRPIEDFEVYDERLNRFVFRSGLIMKPVFAQGPGRAQAGDLCRGRRRAHPARHTSCNQGRLGPAHSGGAAGGDRGAAGTVWS